MKKNALIFVIMAACSNTTSNSEKIPERDASVDIIEQDLGSADVGNDEGSDNDSDQTSNNRLQAEQNLRDALDAYDRDTDFTVMLESDSGERFVHSVGASTPETTYRSASTSKWVTAATILHFVNQGELTLADEPQTYLDFWPTTGSKSEITVGDLLSFRSGLNEDPPCTFIAGDDFFRCVGVVESRNDQAVPNVGFSYGSAHMQIAGAMLINALELTSWTEVFARFQQDTNLFQNSDYSVPSTTNPLLAGGMRWTGNDYMAFLKAMYEESILTPELIQAAHSDQIEGLDIVSSPAKDGIDKDWHYGFGNWFECDANPFDCTERTRVSSPGAFGAYPFIDYEHAYFGLIAREGELGSFREGYFLFAEIEPLILAWLNAQR